MRIMASAQRKQTQEEAVCDVKGCKNPSARSISAKKVGESGLVIERKTGNVHLCKDHYREFKKATKKDRELDRLGW
jgi:hypothetical protein